MNPLYNDIRYNSKIRYNVNLVCIKISESYIFSLIFPCYSLGKHTFVYLLESPRRGDSNKYTNRMIHKKLFKSIRYSCFRRVHIKILYNSKFVLTAKSLVTYSVGIARVLCIRFEPKTLDQHASCFKVQSRRPSDL